MAEAKKRTSQKQVIDAWAKYTIEYLQDELVRLKIGKTQNLYNSFKHELELNGNDVKAVAIKFHFYGRFRDMGVGSGVKAYERKSNRQNLVGARAYRARVDYTKREPKRWFNKRKTNQIWRLKELLDINTSTEVSNFLSYNMEEYTEYKVNL